MISGRTGVLNALRETQLEQGRTLAAHSRRLGGLEEKVGNLEGRVGTLEEKVDSGFAEMREGFAQVETKFTVLKAGQERITELLTAHLGAPGGSER